MYKYEPIYKPNQLICGTGQIAVVTGWTIKESIAKGLSKEQYAAIGNLYSSTRGISFLIRNLLYNPHVRIICILSASDKDLNAKSSECLYDFFTQGFTRGSTDGGQDTWVINSVAKGYIDIEISEQTLNSLRENTEVCFCDSKEELFTAVKERSLFPLPVISEKQTFPEPILKTTYLQGELYGHRVEGETIAETWIKLLYLIRKTGVIRPTGYDGKMQELINLMAVITDEPEDFYFPEPNYLSIDREYLKSYIPQILEDAPYQEGVKYTYGQRLRSWFGQDQIEQVIEKLLKEIDSASAVMSLWDSGSGDENWLFGEVEDVQWASGQAIARWGRKAGDSDHNHGSSPCLNHIWLRVNDGELSLTATLRSNDMFSAWVANAMGLRALQHHIKDAINSRSGYELELGPLITISQSAHIYDDTWGTVDTLIENEYMKLQPTTYDDPVGNFVVEIINNSELIVRQITPTLNIECANYTGKTPLLILRKISKANPAIQSDHIGYLGIELQKAYQYLQARQSTSYVQDRS